MQELERKLKADHSISWCSFRKTGSEGINQGGVVVVGLHQLTPVLGIDFFWCCPTNDVGHSTSSPQLGIAWDPVVASSLDVPRNQVLWSSLDICEKSVPNGVADEEIHLWRGLIGKIHHLVLPKVSFDKVSMFRISSVPTGWKR